MALIKCPECDNEVSTEAAACPKCGYVISKHTSSRLFARVVIGFVVLIGIIAISTNSNKSDNPASQASSSETIAPSESVASEAPASTPAIVDPEPPKPIHMYSVQDGNSFGYEQALSKNDTDQGLVSKPLIMFKLLAKTDTQIRLVSFSSSGLPTYVTCSLPCEYAKIVSVGGYGNAAPDMIKIDFGSILYSAISDAKNGFLDSPQSAADSNAQLPVATTSQVPAQASQTVTSKAEAEENTSFAPSFDCMKAANSVEKMICNDRELSSLDVQLSNIYSDAKAETKDMTQFKAEQDNWIRSRKQCPDRACILQHYSDRIDKLTKEVSN